MDRQPPAVVGDTAAFPGACVVADDGVPDFGLESDEALPLFVPGLTARLHLLLVLSAMTVLLMERSDPSLISLCSPAPSDEAAFSVMVPWVIGNRGSKSSEPEGRLTWIPPPVLVALFSVIVVLTISVRVDAGSVLSAGLR